MILKQLKQQCPIIMKSEDLFDKKKEAMLKQAEFLRNHQFIFKTLTERETEVLKLRYGIDSGKILTCQQVSEILGFSNSRVLQIEQNAFNKMRKMNRLYLMQKYDDTNIDAETISDIMDTDYESLIRKHIYTCAKEGGLIVVKNVAIKDWNMKASRGIDFSLIAKPKLAQNNIYTYLDLIKYLGKHETINQVALDLGISYSGCRILIRQISDLIDMGYISFDNIKDYEKYLKLKQLYDKKYSGKSYSKHQRLIARIQQDEMIEAKKSERRLNAVNNPELCFIEDLNLTARTYNVLKENNINNVKNLLDAKCKLVNHLGEGSLKELTIKMYKLGIHLDLSVNVALNDKIDVTKPETVYIEDLCLSDRTYNALKRAGMHTLKDIMQNPLRLYSIHGLGDKCKDELLNKLKEIDVILVANKVIEITR